MDALRMVQSMNYVWTMEFTAGYNHVMLRLEDWTYCGIRLEGKVYVHAALPFGISLAPEVFTRIAQAGYLGLRAHGEALTAMIVDTVGAARWLHTAATEMGTQMGMLDALG